MEDLETRMDASDRIVRGLVGLTKKLAESHLELSASHRRDKIMIRELKTARRDHEKWMRDHEVRLQFHYRTISDLRDKPR